MSKKRSNNSLYKIPKDPDKLAAEWDRLSGLHFESFQRVRELCDRRIEKLLEDERDPEMAIADLSSSHEIRAIVQTLNTAIEGERQALNMHLQDVTTAIKRVEYFGFLVQRGDGAIEVAAEHVSTVEQPVEQDDNHTRNHYA